MRFEKAICSTHVTQCKQQGKAKARAGCTAGQENQKNTNPCSSAKNEPQHQSRARARVCVCTCVTRRTSSCVLAIYYETPGALQLNLRPPRPPPPPRGRFLRRLWVGPNPPLDATQRTSLVLPETSQEPASCLLCVCVPSGCNAKRRVISGLSACAACPCVHGVGTCVCVCVCGHIHIHMSHTPVCVNTWGPERRRRRSHVKKDFTTVPSSLSLYIHI